MAKFSVKKPLTVFVAVLAILVLGVVAYTKMTPDLLPNMDFPYVVIVTTDPGASPEAVESDITKPMEQAMATLNEIKHISSTSQNSVSMVVLEFEQGVNMDSTGVDIQQKIATLQGGWDDTVGTPYVLKINPTMLPLAVAAASSCPFTASASRAESASIFSWLRITFICRCTSPLTDTLATPVMPSILLVSVFSTNSESSATSILSLDTAATATGSMVGFIFST